MVHGHVTDDVCRVDYLLVPKESRKLGIGRTLIYNFVEYNKTLNELIELLNLKDIINIPVRQLSLGNRMKCEIAASLIHKPEILFLDEPTIGLDAVSKKIVREFIKKINVN